MRFARREAKAIFPEPGVLAAQGGKEIEVAIKASQERAINFTQQSDGHWRTLHSVGLVIAVVPDRKNPDEAEVLAFKRKPLERAFDRAWKALRGANRPIGFNTPVFIPIDEVSHKYVGHDVGNLRKLADWSVHLTAEELAARSSETEEGYIDQFRRRFAAENGVDVNQVMISIVGKPK